MGATSSILDKIPASRLELIIPGIHLPFDDMDDKLRVVLDARLKTEVEALTATIKLDDDLVEGKKKSDEHALDGFVEYFSKLVKNKHLLPPNYKFFGSNNNRENLYHFLRANSFFTPALGIQVGEDGTVQYTIKSLDSDHPTWYSRAVLGYQADYPRVNVVMNAELVLQSYTVYVQGEDKTAEYSEEDALAYLAVTLLFFAEVVHTILHIYNLTMITAILDATEHDAFQSEWVAPYSTNIFVKYVEVQTLLLNEKGGVLTTNQFNSDYGMLLQYSKALLIEWLSYDSAEKLIRGFFFSGIAKTAPSAEVAAQQIQRLLEPTNTLVLSEWRKHAALAAPFAAELTAVFERRKPGSLHQTNENLHKYLGKLGEGVPAVVSTFQGWLEVMSVFGLLHGNTLSMTRWILTRTVLAKFTPQEDTFTARDVGALKTGTGTMSGLENGRRVFSSELLGRDNPYPLLRHVMLKYDGAASQLKAQFFATWTDEPVFYAQHGWIYSDYVLDGIDNKQMTLTTYV